MLAKIQAGLLKYSDCAVWAYWGVPDEGREKGIKKVARSVEHRKLSLIVAFCGSLMRVSATLMSRSGS